MSSPIVKRYSIAFKRQVVSEYESGLSQYHLHKRYGMSYSSLDRWIKTYSRSGFRHKQMYIQKPAERDRIKVLEARIATLEQALAQATLDKMMLETIIEVAEEEEGIAFKKNTVRKSSAAFTKKGR